jgi:hypothetical protein
MEKLIEEFEKALEAYKEQTGKLDNLVGLGRIVVDELRKARASNITLGQLLADFYSQAQRREERVALRTQQERLQHEALLWRHPSEVNGG